MPAPIAGTAALPDGVLAIYDVDAFLTAADEVAPRRGIDGGGDLTLPADVLRDARALVRDRLGLDFPARKDADLTRALHTASDDPRGLVAALRDAAPRHRRLARVDRRADRAGELLLPRSRAL